MIWSRKKTEALKIVLTALNPPTQAEIDKCRRDIDSNYIKTKAQIELMEKAMPLLRITGLASIAISLLGLWNIYYGSPNSILIFAAGIFIVFTILGSTALLKHYKIMLATLGEEYFKMETVNIAIKPDLVMKYCRLCNTFGTLHHYNKKLLEQPRYPLNIELDSALSFQDRVHEATRLKLIERENRSRQKKGVRKT